MGKGDQRSKRGKIIAGSFGKSRMRVSKLEKKDTTVQAAPVEAKPKAAAKKKAAK